jgi:dihydrofolate reductase
MRLSLVAAVAENGVIGNDGAMPWHYPDDLRHFRETTVGHPVIMGRHTFDAIGGPLPDRDNVVLSSTPESLPDSVIAVSSLDAATAAASDHDRETAYVVGGAAVYHQFLPAADELVLSELDDTYPGDTTFPAVDWDRWRTVERDRYDGFTVVRYRLADG